ncbi:MAG TPA: HemK2/MTQ2 family protein methyltransferase [Candidatus Nanoarchaeia archaeon]|nr:HemK2/MTQ2 family protein methyltransferase [Candidatus Nanoarchaeia archaeon]
MPACKSGYDPQEDSTMLEKHARLLAKGKVLDVGTGSGIQAIAAAQSSRVDSVLAIDVQKGVINYCKKNITNRKIKFAHSDLFKNVKGTFDTIIFNPPYLPQELKIRDKELEGGKKGYEVIEEFLGNVNNYLNADGLILMVFSSLTNKEKINEFIKNSLLEFEELEKMHIFFEDLFVYKIKKSEMLKKFEKIGIENARYFAKGHRGLLFRAEYKKKDIVIKAKNPQSHAFGRIENEISWLKRLNKVKIGPKLLYSSDEFFFYEYIGGDFIVDYAEKSPKQNIKKMLKNVFMQMHKMDKIKVDKEEMHHPVKHVIVSKNIPFLIDFERARYSQNPKNVTQFCQFLISTKFNSLLSKKGIKVEKSKLMELAKIYKTRQTNDNLKNIIGIL